MQSLRLILKNSRYFGPVWVFASLNMWFGTWAIYIPFVKDKLSIDKSSLGLAIFFLALGVFTVLPFAANLINRIGVGRATWYAVILTSITALFPLAAPSYWTLAAALFVFGLCNGFIDIAMNTLVTEIEKEDKKHFMSAAHGFFSLGGVLAGLASFAIPWINNPPLHMLIVVILVFMINLGFSRHYIHIKAAPIEKQSFSFKLFRPLLLLAVISFIIMGSEGAMVDWSALYLKEISLAPEYLIGSGFLAFSTMMMLGRFLGDGISSRIGSVRMIISGSLIAILGYIAVLSTYTILAIAGFALIGLGFSVIVPELFRMGGRVKGVESAQGIAFIAGTGYAGFLAAPPVLGYLADLATLKLTFTTLLICCGVVLLITLLYRWFQQK